ncbi:MAG: metalloregulator ArsR/SmtB family transcription factor [Candidatus Zixiibacteriota bacterium]
MTKRAPGPVDLSPALRALSDPTRLKIMLMLEGRRRTVGEIVEFFALSQPTISRHLQALAQAGLVRRERQGQRVFYAIATERMRTVCIDLAACFPCCCRSIEIIAVGPSATARARRTRTETHSRSRKGGTS